MARWLLVCSTRGETTVGGAGGKEGDERKWERKGGGGCAEGELQARVERRQRMERRRTVMPLCICNVIIVVVRLAQKEAPII